MVAIVQRSRVGVLTSALSEDGVVITLDGNQEEVDAFWCFGLTTEGRLYVLTRVGRTYEFREGWQMLFHFTGEMEDVKLVERERVEELIALEAVFYGHPGRLVVSRTEMVAKIDGVTLTSPVTGITLENGVPTLRLEGVLEGHRVALVVPHPR